MAARLKLPACIKAAGLLDQGLALGAKYGPKLLPLADDAARVTSKVLPKVEGAAVKALPKVEGLGAASVRAVPHSVPAPPAAVAPAPASVPTGAGVGYLPKPALPKPTAGPASGAVPPAGAAPPGSAAGAVPPSPAARPSGGPSRFGELVDRFARFNPVKSVLAPAPAGAVNTALNLVTGKGVLQNALKLLPGQGRTTAQRFGAFAKGTGYATAGSALPALGASARGEEGAEAARMSVSPIDVMAKAVAPGMAAANPLLKRLGLNLNMDNRHTDYGTFLGKNIEDFGDTAGMVAGSVNNRIVKDRLLHTPDVMLAGAHASVDNLLGNFGLQNDQKNISSLAAEMSEYRQKLNRGEMTEDEFRLANTEASKRMAELQLGPVGRYMAKRVPEVQALHEQVRADNPSAPELLTLKKYDRLHPRANAADPVGAETTQVSTPAPQPEAAVTPQAAAAPQAPPPQPPADLVGPPNPKQGIEDEMRALVRKAQDPNLPPDEEDDLVRQLLAKQKQHQQLAGSTELRPLTPAEYDQLDQQYQELAPQYREIEKAMQQRLEAASGDINATPPEEQKQFADLTKSYADMGLKIAYHRASAYNGRPLTPQEVKAGMTTNDPTNPIANQGLANAQQQLGLSPAATLSVWKGLDGWQKGALIAGLGLGTIAMLGGAASGSPLLGLMGLLTGAAVAAVGVSGGDLNNLGRKDFWAETAMRGALGDIGDAPESDLSPPPAVPQGGADSTPAPASAPAAPADPSGAPAPAAPPATTAAAPPPSDGSAESAVARFKYFHAGGNSRQFVQEVREGIRRDPSMRHNLETLLNTAKNPQLQTLAMKKFKLRPDQFQAMLADLAVALT